MTLTTRIPSVPRSEPLAAGMAGLAAQSVLMLVRAVTNRRAVHRLDEMPDYLLKDVGLTRDDVHSALASDWREDPSVAVSVAAARRRRRIGA
jgi:uncharacterized protein YjiS (DUF1127 family)